MTLVHLEGHRFKVGLVHAACSSSLYMDMFSVPCALMTVLIKQVLAQTLYYTKTSLIPSSILAIEVTIVSIDVDGSRKIQ